MEENLLNETEEAIVEVLEQQIAFESERLKIDHPFWSKEYHKGYIDGLKQAVNVVKDN